MKNKKTILFVCPYFSSFIKEDIEILSENNIVIINNYNWQNKFLIFSNLFFQFFSILFKINRVNIIVVSFGGYWSFFPSLIGKVFKKPVYIILHGTDCASLPNLNYGSLRKPILKLFCKISYRFSFKLLPVSSSLIKVKNTFLADDKYSYQGINYFFPNLKINYSVIYNGIDTNFWQNDLSINKVDNSFLAVFSEKQFILKGGDLIIKIAEKFPEIDFNIVGTYAPSYIKNIPSNVNFLGKLDKNQLKKVYCNSRYYFQLSIFEGFGCSLAEAMACECIPIGSSVNIIPEIIGDSGKIIQYKKEDELESVIKNLLTQKDLNKKGQEARIRILKLYSKEIRKSCLNNELFD